MHGLHFLAGTLLHADTSQVAARLPGVLQALFALCEDAPDEVLAHTLLAASEHAHALLQPPLLHCPYEDLISGYTDLLLHLVRCAARARGAADALLSFLAALLRMLPDAVGLIRRGGREAEAAHVYLLLLRRVASEGQWGRGALTAAASAYELRLLRIYVEEMDEEEQREEETADAEMERLPSSPGGADDEAMYDVGRGQRI